MKKLRLLFTKKCNRNCEGCCNKDWDLEALPVFTMGVTSLEGFNEILITGGEPLLFPVELNDLVNELKEYYPHCKIYIYTAWAEDWRFSQRILLQKVDGFTITLHDQKSAEDFVKQEIQLVRWIPKTSSIRLNIFEDIMFPLVFTQKYKVKEGMRWIKDCPLPTDEIFMRYES